MAKSDPVRLRPRRGCPICGKPSQQKFHPFCSPRCADIDLGRWLGGKYAVPAEEPPGGDDDGDDGDTPKQAQ
jgi:hypothetical protein